MKKQQKSAQLKARTMNICIALIVCIGLFMCFPSVYAWEWDNVKSVDSTTNTITIRNSFLGIPTSEVATVKLDTPINVYVMPGENRLVAQFTINNKGQYDAAFKKMEFYDVKQNLKEINRDFTYKYKIIIGTKDQPIIEAVCDKGTMDKNGFITKNCANKITGYEKVNVYDWKTIEQEKLSSLPQGEITIGVFTNVYSKDSVEWIPTLFGIKINEWASWTDSLNTDLIFYYKLNETSGDVKDSSSSNDGKIQGSITQGESGKIGESVLFTSGTHGRINTTISLDGFSSVTMSFWFNRNLLTGEDEKCLFTDADIGGSGIHSICMYNDEHINTKFAGQTNHDTTGFGTGSWHNIVVVFQKNENITTFLDGVWAGYSGMTVAFYDTGAGMSKNFFIGAQPSFLDSGFGGYVDEVSFWNRTLSGDEVAQLYNSGNGITYSLASISMDVVNSQPKNNLATSSPVTFGCNATSSNNNISSILLNVTGTANFTQEITSLNEVSYNAIFTNDTLPNGLYHWNCIAYGATVNGASSSWTFDTTLHNTCYQETANATSTCGGLSYGNYAFTIGNASDGTWYCLDSGLNSMGNTTLCLYDGDWLSHIGAPYGGVASNNTMYVNYSIPPKTIAATWQFKYNYSETTENITIPLSCLNYAINTLQLRVDIKHGSGIFPGGGEGVFGACYNATDWDYVLSASESSMDNFYEEGINWDISSTDFTPSIYNLAPLDGNVNGGKFNISAIIVDSSNVSFSDITTTLYIDNIQAYVIHTNPVTIPYIQEVNVGDTVLSASHKTEGAHIWRLYTINNYGFNATSVNKTYFVDTSPPLIIINTPKANNLNFTIAAPQNVSFNVTINDTLSNVTTCLYSIDNMVTNTTTNCATSSSEGFNVLISNYGKNNVYIWAKDTFGSWNSSYVQTNVMAYNQKSSITNSLGGDTVTFYLTLNATDIKTTNANITLKFNNTNYPGSLFSIGTNAVIYTASISIPTNWGNETGNTLQWSWNVTTIEFPNFATTTKTLTVYSLGIDNCSVYSNNLFNFKLFDEDSREDLNGTIEAVVDVYIPGTSSVIATYNNSFNYDTSTQNAKVCLSNQIWNFTINYQTKYYSNTSLYAAEYKHGQGLIFYTYSSVQNIDLYDLLLSRSTSFKFTIQGANLANVENAIVDVQRQYLPSNLFISVESPKTDSSGTTIAHLVAGDVYYNFIILQNGAILGTFLNYRVTCVNSLTGDCPVNLNLLKSTSTIKDYSTYGNLSVSFTLDKNSRILTMPYLTTDGLAHKVQWDVLKLDQWGNNTICTQTETSSTGAFTCPVPTSYGNSSLLVNIFSDDVFIGRKSFSLADTAANIFGGVRVLIGMLLYSTIVMLMMANPIMIILGSFLGLILASALFVIDGVSLFSSVATLAYFIIAGAIIIHYLRNKT